MSEPAPYDPILPEALEDEVLAILDGDDAVRDDALRAVLASNPAHVRTIRAWLQSADVPLPTSADEAAAADHSDPDALPRDLGAYRLLELIGRGGFGSVFRAEQQAPIQREVAIKVINPGMDSREILSRFYAEREALNRMDHPGIARLLDAGTTEQGRPFFVMELVVGPTLAALCRQRHLALTERLELFLQVLDAMEHAHQKAVIHRDLSSNNVLVADSDGRLQPKIIDFGIAKSLADPLLQGGAMTFQGTLMGTPEFMSPEQAAGRTADIDTRADVYSLGVQFYELLTDQLPIPGVVLRAQGIQGMADAIQTHQPPPPSAVAAKDRQAALRGDLDAIAMRAIGKRREERYGSVADFAADVRRHLAHEPVFSAAPSTWYRLRKFARRHRAETLAAGGLAAGLLIATSVLIWALLTTRAALDETERQKQEIERKADAGFRLLANEELLRTARAAALELPPPWPEHRQAYADWLAEHGDPLDDERAKLQEKLDQLEASQQASGGRFASIVDRHLWKALLQLQRELEQFSAFGGPLQRTRRQLELLDDLIAPQLELDRELWQRTIEDIRSTYHGLLLRPLPGLMPIGQNQTTGLFEFRDLLTSGHDEPIVFVLIPAGTFRMGAIRGRPGLPQNDPAAADNELGGQLTSLDDFLIARTELTQGQWSALAEEVLPDGADDSLPASGIDWHRARLVLRRYDLDLPTEAQWEYACRAGSTTPWSVTGGSTALASVAHFGATPLAAAQLDANAWGLFDLHGNVAEWCRDQLLDYDSHPPHAGDGRRRATEPAADGPRVVRGGAYHQAASATRSSARDYRPPSTREPAIGVRPIRLLHR